MHIKHSPPPSPPPPLPPVPLHHQLEHLYRGIHSQERQREMSRQGRHGLSSLPGLSASPSITPSILSCFPASPFLIHSPPLGLFLFLSCHLHCEERLRVSSEPGLCKQSGRDEKQRCCTQNSEAQSAGCDLKFCRRWSEMRDLFKMCCWH